VVESQNVKNALTEFSKRVVKEARTSLTKQDKNASKKLYDSIGYTMKVSENSFSLSFDMESYGQFQDKGVSGVKKKYNAPFAYTTKMPPSSAFDKWTVKKGIAPREKGKFSSRKAVNFAIARSVFINGIKPSLFFTKPFESAFSDLPDEVVTAFGLDVDNFLKYTLK